MKGGISTGTCIVSTAEMYNLYYYGMRVVFYPVWELFQCSRHLNMLKKIYGNNLYEIICILKLILNTLHMTHDYVI